MPLKLNVGVSKKVGLPDYGSAGATCNLELELDSGLLESDLDGFHERVRSAYIAAQQAVHDELARLQRPAARPVAQGDGPAEPRNGAVTRRSDPRVSNGPSPRSCKPATANQVRALSAIARRHDLDLGTVLQDAFGVDRPEDLSLSQASQLIDRLRATTEG